MHMGTRSRLASVLIDLEAELRQLGFWDADPPTAAALASQQPFAVDTLTLPQWLQFIFLPKMYALIETEQPLPGKCGIAPMAEEYFRGRSVGISRLLAALEEVDHLLCGGAPDYSPVQRTARST